MPVSLIHAIGSLSHDQGGPSVSVPMLCDGLATSGCNVLLCAIGDRDHNSPEQSAFRTIRVKRSLRFHRFEYSLGLRSVLHKLAPDVDLIHSHGLWSQINRESAIVASRSKLVHVLSPRGMLEPWALNHHKRRKIISRWIFQDRALHQADCLHATSLKEYHSIREFGLENPVAVIPNGVAVNKHAHSEDQNHFYRRWPELEGKRIILFLSRIHAIKGLINLVHAWSIVCNMFPNWQLVIAGPDVSGHETQIRRAVRDSSASRQTTFVGPVWGIEKTHLYAACNLFVLPTFSENFGIVVAEALASAKPVITTTAAPWKDLVTCNCGWWIDVGVEPLVAALKEAIRLSDEERTEMGLRGQKLIETSYSWTMVANKMIQVYEWCLGKAEKPNCLHLQ